MLRFLGSLGARDGSDEHRRDGSALSAGGLLVPQPISTMPRRAFPAPRSRVKVCRAS